jgi:hypothetical protein
MYLGIKYVKFKFIEKLLDINTILIGNGLYFNGNIFILIIIVIIFTLL